MGGAWSLPCQAFGLPVMNMLVGLEKSDSDLGSRVSPVLRQLLMLKHRTCWSRPRGAFARLCLGRTRIGPCRR